jgi:hypothetical protein
MDDIMSTLRSRLPDSDAWPEAGNHTIGLLAHLASRHHVPLPASEQKALDCLCRKSDFLGQVRIAYDADWRMALDKRPLPLDAWPVLILSLLVFGAAVDDGTGDGRGRVLKWANSAFNAMELYRSLGGREALIPRPSQIAASAVQGRHSHAMHRRPSCIPVAEYCAPRS